MWAESTVFRHSLATRLQTYNPESSTLNSGKKLGSKYYDLVNKNNNLILHKLIRPVGFTWFFFITFGLFLSGVASIQPYPLLPLLSHQLTPWPLWSPPALLPGSSNLSIILLICPLSLLWTCQAISVWPLIFKHLTCTVPLIPDCIHPRRHGSFIESLFFLKRIKWVLEMYNSYRPAGFIHLSSSHILTWRWGVQNASVCQIGNSFRHHNFHPPKKLFIIYHVIFSLLTGSA